MKAANLNMAEYLFHSINPYNILIEHTENLTLDQKRMEECCRITKRILETGYILPRCELEQILSRQEYFKLIFYHGSNWNEDNRISITVHPDNKIIETDTFHPDSTKAYENYVVKYPTLILNSDLLNNLSFHIDAYNTMVGEIQIEEKIPAYYIIGISLPNIINLNTIVDCINHPSKYQNYILQMAKDFQYLSEEDFLNTYYYEVICFERMLKEINSDLKLYHTDTGYPIKSSKEQIKLIRKIKKQI